jgi:hypothetical protein
VKSDRIPKKKTPPYREVFVVSGYFSLYLGVKLWYASRLAEIYTHIPDIHRTAMIVVTL